LHFLVSVILLFALPPPTLLQAEPRAQGIEEIVVTARRREETAQSVPIPITALSGDELERRAALDMIDLARITPNLSFEHGGVARNTAQVFLRGIGQTNWGPAQDPKVGIYLDGVYLARPQGAVFDLLDIERVEVLRGPQGTLFGRNTTAGLIHVITKRPGDTFEVGLHGLAGDDGQLGGGITVNIPITDTLAARVSAQHRESDGYVENRFNGDDWYDENGQNARASLAWTPNDRFDALLSFDYQRVRETPTLATCRWVGGDNLFALSGLDGLAALGDFADDVKATCEANKPYSGFEEDPNDESNIDAWGGALTLTYDLTEDLTLTSITAYRDIEEVNGSWGLTGDSPMGDIISVQQRSSLPSEYDQFSQEIRISGVAMEDRLAFVAGVYYFTEDAKATFDVPLFEGWMPVDCAANPFATPCFPAGPGLTFGDIILATQASGFFQEFDAGNDSQAVFIEATYDITEALSVTAGIRYTEDDRELTLLQQLLLGLDDPRYVCPDGSPPVQRKCSVSDDFTETTPRVIVNYKFNDDIMVYGSWSKGYSSGGFNQDPRLSTYEPEVSKNWELGMKSTWFDRRLKVNVTGYHNDYQNQQLSVARTVNNQQVILILNAQEATLYGFELEMQALLGNWTMSLTAGTTDGKYDKFSVQDSTIGPAPDFVETFFTRDLSGNELVLGAPYTASLGIGYLHNFDSGGSLDVNVGYSHRGRQFNNIDEYKGTRQDAFGLVDARVTWTLPNGRTAISLVGNNLTDKEYFAAATGDAASARDGFFWAPPRRVRAEIRHFFGD
jgi:iron complex outermembrane receptor protein